MTELSDEKLIEIGRAVQEQLKPDGAWPRILVFELFDHKRRLVISELRSRVAFSDPEKCPESLTLSEVKFSGAPYII